MGHAIMQGVLSRAPFRRSAVSGQRYFTVFSLHISNIYAKKKGIAKKLILTLRALMISRERRREEKREERREKREGERREERGEKKRRREEEEMRRDEKR